MSFRHCLPAALLFAAPAMAQDIPAGPDAGLAMAQVIATTMDTDSDGEISAAELVAFSDQVFVSVDIDGSGGATADEFLNWEFGFADLATFRNRDQAYAAVSTFLHDLFDTDDDGVVDAAEHRDGVLRSRDYADRNRDGRMEMAEFLRGFIYSMAMRSALTE